MKKRRRKTSKTFQKGKILPMVERIARYYKQNPDVLKHLVMKAYPELKDHTCCANCGASMAEYTHHLDSLDALLVYTMARIVRERLHKGMTFPEANKVHIQSKVKSFSTAVSLRGTKVSKLGLIAKVMRKTKNGTLVHDQRAGWLITKRGWAFLRGEQVPSSVTTFRNEIIDRPAGTITIGEAFATKTKGNNQYESEISTYKINEWVDISGYAQGLIL